MTAAPVFGQLPAPAAWRTVDLISDLHLQASDPATFEAWRDYMARTPADAVLVLGDLFEVWVGDDAVQGDAFLQSCAHVLQQASARRPVYFMPGNRDFLVGSAFLATCGVRPLIDPTVMQWGPQRLLLTHGDALCLADEAYQRFRIQARSLDWQAAFLARPLTERQTLAQSMRDQSKAHNQSMVQFADADPELTRLWLAAAHSAHMVHGHTHLPADHANGTALRQVLSDWSCDKGVLRAEVLRLHANGEHLRLRPEAA